MMPSPASKWGLVSIDGERAFLGKASSPDDFKVVGEDTSRAHSKTRRGGSSSSRFQRQRQLAELLFLRRVAEKAAKHFADVAHILVGGKADNKTRLLAELRPMERSRVLKSLTMDCDSSREACKRLAREIESSKRGLQAHHEQVVLKEFMDCLDRDLQESYCFGADQCNFALQLGAVKVLLLSKNCGLSQELEAMARATKASTVTVCPTTAVAHRFCHGVGMGALLRWPISHLELEEWCKDAERDSSTTDGSTADGSDAEDAAVGTSETAPDHCIHHSDLWYGWHCHACGTTVPHPSRSLPQ